MTIIYNILMIITVLYVLGIIAINVALLVCLLIDTTNEERKPKEKPRDNVT